jgi:hypothetical protein
MDKKCSISTQWSFIQPLRRMKLHLLLEKCMELEILMLRKIIESHKDSYCIFLLFIEGNGKQNKTPKIMKLGVLGVWKGKGKGVVRGGIRKSIRGVKYDQSTLFSCMEMSCYVQFNICQLKV